MEFNSIVKIGCACKMDESVNAKDGLFVNQLIWKTVVDYAVNFNYAVNFEDAENILQIAIDKFRYSLFDVGPPIAVIECPDVSLMKSRIPALGC
ncbi:hypothetical protein L1987_42724 [Smallanthus sonchifolius]|uniref:Uncharacterized protein n=1 Tax=Smallanthus sonchifolius TaxID=185202 RepID=A0ACB9GJE9_9ASTR|nr:hypothetical protein L1987_42724 [Smallanthus sonchifolius]